MNTWILELLGSSQGKPGITIQRVPHSFKTQSVLLTLAPGALLALHKTPVDVLFYVVKGEGILTIGDEQQNCPQGTYAESPKDILHGWENQGQRDFQVLVIKLFH